MADCGEFSRIETFWSMEEHTRPENGIQFSGLVQNVLTSDVDIDFGMIRFQEYRSLER